MNASAPSDDNAAALRRDARRERLLLLTPGAPALLVVALLLCLPIGWMFWLALVGAAGEMSGENFARLAADESFPIVMSTTFQIAVVVTVVCVVLGYPLSYLLSELPPRLAGLLMIAVILPFWTSILVRTYAWLLLLQRRGLVNNWLTSLGLIDEPLRLAHNFTGTVIGMVHVMLPFLVLPLYASMRQIDRNYARAAANLGATPVRVFWSVFFPLSLPGLAAGTFLVFVLCLGFYVTPAVLGGGRVIMIAQAIQSNMTFFSNWGAASALGVVLFICTMSILLLAVRLTSRRGSSFAGGLP